MKNFFDKVGRWFTKVFKAIGRWFESLVVATDSNEPKLKTLVKSKGFESFSASLIAAILGLVVGLIIMLFVNPAKAGAGFGMMLIGGFSGGARGVGNVLYYATPLIMTGLSVGFAFKTGLFNIGASGQYTVGMYFAMFCAFHFCEAIPGRFLWVICVLAAMVGGMIWGAIPGIFKAFLNVNEVITCIMLNYIGMITVDMLIKMDTKIFDGASIKTFIMPENANIPKLGMDKLFPGSYVTGGIILAVIIAIIIYIVLNKTVLGYELKACGSNKDAAKYAGISQNRNIILSMAIAGGLAGIGAALHYQAGVGSQYSPVNSMLNMGFNGIAVALLGVSNPIGIIVAGVFFAHLQQGGFYIQTIGFKSEIIDIIVGIIIYFSAFALIIRGAIPKVVKFFKKKSKDALIKEVVAENTEINIENSDAKEDK